MHLKCKSDKLNINPSFSSTDYNPDILDPQAYNIQNNTKMFDLQYEEIKHNADKIINPIISLPTTIDNPAPNTDVSIKVVWNKLNLLKQKLRNNDVSDKRSACFWCTYEFDNPAVLYPETL